MAERKNKNSLGPWWHPWDTELINLGTALPLDGLWYKIINLLIVWSCWVEFAAAKVKKANCVIRYRHLRRNSGALSPSWWLIRREILPWVKLYTPCKHTCTLTGAHTRTLVNIGQKNGSNYLNIVTRRTSLGLKPKVQGPSFVQIRDMKHHQVGLGENKPIKLWHLLVSCPWA